MEGKSVVAIGASRRSGYRQGRACRDIRDTRFGRLQRRGLPALPLKCPFHDPFFRVFRLSLLAGNFVPMFRNGEERVEMNALESAKLSELEQQFVRGLIHLSGDRRYLVSITPKAASSFSRVSDAERCTGDS